MDWIHLVFVLVIPNIHEICFKLKSGFRIIHKFSTNISLNISLRKTHQTRNVDPKLLLALLWSLYWFIRRGWLADRCTIPYPNQS
jgi:hypothetical protein